MSFFLLSVDLMPGKDPGGFIITILLGIAGASIAIYFGQVIGWYKAGQTSGWDHVNRRCHDAVAALSVPFQAQAVALRYRGQD